jgi:hypothetical protein
VYNFYSYCTVYLEQFCVPGLEQIVMRKQQQKHIFPISLFCGENAAPMTAPSGSNGNGPINGAHSNGATGSPFLRLCRHGVINYVVTRPLTTTIAFITNAIGTYSLSQIRHTYVLPLTLVTVKTDGR